MYRNAGINLQINLRLFYLVGRFVVKPDSTGQQENHFVQENSFVRKIVEPGNFFRSLAFRHVDMGITLLYNTVEEKLRGMKE